ncbi:hypothetical protein Tco_1143320 [Tanacetum coccineum]
MYHALLEALIEDENVMDKGVADTVQDHKRKHDDDEDDDDEDPPARPNQGNKTKRRITKESESSKKPSTTKEPPKGHTGHLTVAADYFFNNELEYLKSSDPERLYTTSITKIKATRYEIKGIVDMVPTLWSPTKVGYDKDILKRIKHWGEGRKLWHISQLNKFSKHNVYSTKKILAVKSVSVKKLHGYGHLEEIVLFHLTDNDISDFIMALRMFTKSLIIKKRVEDLQLGVESYQRKLNITLPQQTARDGTLKKVRDELHHRMRERRIIRNLKRLVGARELEMEYKLMTRTT